MLRRSAVTPLAGALIALCMGAPGVHARAEISIFADSDADARTGRALVQYRLVADRGGWPRVQQGRVLIRGIIDAQVQALRGRLVATGDLPARRRSGRVFGARVERAVRRFQERHGLVADGIVGPATLEALNAPAASRVAALELNRTRLGVLRRRIAGSGIVVNVAAATLDLLREGRVAFHSTAIVGRPDWPTPLLHSAVTAIDINPFWHVPRRIARGELFPRARQDPGYLASRGIRVLSAGEGGTTEIPYDRIDWNAAMAGSAYRLRQDPGPRNALGAVRFAFDNPHGVFLHDTPDKALFKAADRALSHGCVRVENATDLAARLVAQDRGGDGISVAEAIASGKTSRIGLTRPVPIHIVYLTAWVDRGGRAQFRRDIYRKDRPGAAVDPGLAPCGPSPAAARSAG